MGQRPLDPDSLAYLRHWEPVLAGPGRHVLERVVQEPRVLLDLGAGTGSLTLAAAERWPSAAIIALDASEAMLGVARSRVTERGPDLGRVEWLGARAEAIPRRDATVDAAVSSFVLQLVANRPVVLAEVRRVLRPGGTFSFVTWLVGDLDVPADAAYHEVLGDLGGHDDADEVCSPRAGDYRSPEEARRELAAAGFESVEVAREELRYVWTAESYLAFKESFDDHERLDSLDRAERERLHRALVERLGVLPADAFVLRGQLVSGVARRPRA